MIEYKYLSNTKKLTLGFREYRELDKSDILNSIQRKYKEFGISTEGKNTKLYLIIDDNWYDFEESLFLSGDDITVILVDVIPPKNAVNYDTYEGIYYFFHTGEQRHEHNPHIHAIYESQEISIYLNDYHIAGKFSNSAKQNQAIKYVKKNRQSILKEWHRIIAQLK